MATIWHLDMGIYTAPNGDWISLDLSKPMSRQWILANRAGEILSRHATREDAMAGSTNN